MEHIIDYLKVYWRRKVFRFAVCKQEKSWNHLRELCSMFFLLPCGPFQLYMMILKKMRSPWYCTFVTVVPRRFLTADAGFPAEERIMKSGADISAGLLKVGAPW